jgi:hypothetical protein
MRARACLLCCTDALLLAHGGSASEILTRTDGDLPAQPGFIDREYRDNQTDATLASLGAIGINTCETGVLFMMNTLFKASPLLGCFIIACGSSSTAINYVRNMRTIEDEGEKWQAEHRLFRELQQPLNMGNQL